MKKIGVVGIGKLGLDCAEVMAEKHEVRGYDIYPRTSDSVKVCDINELVNESEWIFIAVTTDIGIIIVKSEYLKSIGGIDPLNNFTNTI